MAESLAALMEKAVDLGYFKGFQIKSLETLVSHLQYEDDTLFNEEAFVVNL